MSLPNIIVFIGFLQGLSLCIFSWQKARINLWAYISICLLLGSLTLFNFFYLLIYNQIQEVSLVPIPYKYLIGVGFFLFIQSHFQADQEKLFNKWFYLFTPAILYGLLRLYWWILSLNNRPHIIREIYDTGFFTFNEFIYLTFNLVLVLIVIRKLNLHEKLKLQVKVIKRVKWLKSFSYWFLTFTSIHIALTIFFAINGHADPFINYYLILFLNSAYIYYLSYLGFTQQQYFFPPVSILEPSPKKSKKLILLNRALKGDELFKKPNLTIAEVAVHTNISTKEITGVIATTGMNFPEYLNTLRVEEVKRLLNSEKSKNFTIEALAKEAGFNSKATFNTSFKKTTGLTPSAYLKSLPK